MGNSKSRKKKNEPKDFFGRLHHAEELKKQTIEEIRKRSKEGPQPAAGPSVPGVPPPRPPRTDPQPPSVPYDKEAIERMRYQLKHNPTAFLLNNIMLSVQFLDNYEKILSYLKNDSITETDRKLNDDMAQHQKHVFLPDKLQEIVDGHVRYVDRYSSQENGETSRKPLYMQQAQAKKDLQVLQPQRMYIIHDNIEVNEPGEIADYSTINNAPHYSFLMEGSEEPGFVKLRKLDVNRKINQDLNYNESPPSVDMKNPDNIESGAESDVSDISKDKVDTEGMDFMNALRNKVNQPPKSAFKLESDVDINSNQIPAIDSRFALNEISTSERRPSGILKPTSEAAKKGMLAQSKSRPKKTKKKEIEEKYIMSESESSGYKSSHSPQTESDYGYATITNETTPRRLEISQLAKTFDSTSEIPMRCISIVEVKKMQNDDDDDDDSEDPYESRYGEFQRELYKKIHYLNSRIFTLNFSDLFQLKLAHSLGFDSDSLVNALTQGASIYCNINKGKNINSFEVLPAISMTWPSDALEWILRKRNKITNPRTNFVYQWPTKDMIGKARALGCFAIPLGFMPTRGVNPSQGVQWKLTFPTVERYLETCMAHSHVRCYLFTLILFKKFIEIKNSNIGLNPSHIKNHLFWQMEDNYARWPEDRLGEVLILFLRSFYEHLMKSTLPYYFVPKCNLIKSIPKTILLKQQKRLADILESPVMHLLSALRNIKFVKSEFYPVLNFKRLYRIITCEDTLRLINPNLPIEMPNPSDEEEDSEYKPKIGFWEDAKKQNPEYHWKVQQLRQIKAKKAAEAIVVAQKSAPKDLIELKKKIPVFDQNRKRLVLELFIPHFITLAETSVKYESLRQALIYLEHAKRLSVILKDEPVSEAQGREYIAMINKKIEELKTHGNKPNIVPEVPRRNSFILPRESIRQKPSEKYVNLNSPTQSEHYGNYRHGPDSPTTKIASVVFADVHVEVEKPIRAVSFQKLDEESENSDADLEESKL